MTSINNFIAAVSLPTHSIPNAPTYETRKPSFTQSASNDNEKVGVIAISLLTSCQYTTIYSLEGVKLKTPLATHYCYRFTPQLLLACPRKFRKWLISLTMTGDFKTLSRKLTSGNGGRTVEPTVQPDPLLYANARGYLTAIDGDIAGIHMHHYLGLPYVKAIFDAFPPSAITVKVLIVKIFIIYT
jgi:hypothetical protein